MTPKGPCDRALVLIGTIGRWWGYKRWSLVGGLQVIELVPFEGMWDIGFFLFVLLDCHKVSTLLYICSLTWCAILPQVQKQWDQAIMWAKVTLSPCKLIILGICYSNGKLTSALRWAFVISLVTGYPVYLSSPPLSSLNSLLKSLFQNTHPFFCLWDTAVVPRSQGRVQDFLCWTYSTDTVLSEPTAQQYKASLVE
jgi:hypothetical protein